MGRLRLEELVWLDQNRSSEHENEHPSLAGASLRIRQPLPLLLGEGL